jgi:hypothetical protein
MESFSPDFACLSLFPRESNARTLGFHWNSLTGFTVGLDPGFLLTKLIESISWLSVNRKPDGVLCGDLPTLG